MSFSNQQSHVKNRVVETLLATSACSVLVKSVPPPASRSKLCLYNQARNVAEDRFFAVDRGLW
jgi:hypothetical protein